MISWDWVICEIDTVKICVFGAFLGGRVIREVGHEYASTYGNNLWKIQCSSLYPCIMCTIKYQSHLEQNFVHYNGKLR